MFDLKELEEYIIDFGLSPREVKVYITLFNKKDFTASEIQQLVNIPRTKVYEVLYRLIGKGLCAERKIGRLKKYEAVDPEYSLDKLLMIYRKDLDVKENMTKQILKILSPLYEKRKGEDNPLEYIEIIKDKEQVRKKWLSINKNAKKEILIFTKPPYASSPKEAITEEKNLRNTNKDRRQVIQRDICEYKGITSESEKKEFIKMVSALISNGEEVRIVKELPMKLAIFDENITMLSLNDIVSFQQSITTMIINHHSFAMSQKFVFENIWGKAMSFEEFKIKFEESPIEADLSRAF